MTREEKLILIRDLSQRLPYGVLVQYKQTGFNSSTYYNDVILNERILLEFRTTDCNIELKPYLRSIKSITSDEQEKFINILSNIKDELSNDTILSTYKVFDYLNSIHVDYRGLIKKNLAKEVTQETLKDYY